MKLQSLTSRELGERKSRERANQTFVLPQLNHPACLFAAWPLLGLMDRGDGQGGRRNCSSYFSSRGGEVAIIWFVRGEGISGHWRLVAR